MPEQRNSNREQLTVERPEVTKPRTTFSCYPDTADILEGVAPNIRNKSFSIMAEVTIENTDAEGVLMSQGSRFGGHALFLKGGGKLGGTEDDVNAIRLLQLEWLPGVVKRIPPPRQ